MDKIIKLLKAYNERHPELTDSWHIGCRIVFYDDGSGHIQDGIDNNRVAEFRNLNELETILKES